MPRRKGTPNTLQIIIGEIVTKHQTGVLILRLSEEYKKPVKTIKNMITRENNKRQKEMQVKFQNLEDENRLKHYKNISIKTNV